MGRAQLLVEGLSAFRAVDRLAKGGVEVLSARKTQKNALFIEVKSADLQKGFAILRTSCYNVKKVRFLGVTRILRRAYARAGLLVGACAFCAIVVFLQSRVLRIDVVGSGSCYDSEVRALLQEEGIGFLSSVPEQRAMLTAKMLAYPRVSYCDVSHEAGRLTVRIEVSDEGITLPCQPLYSSVAGRVAELTVVRGYACVQVGDSVAAGDTLVDCRGGSGEVLVIASATVQFSCEVPNQTWTQQRILDWANLKFVGAEGLCVVEEGGVKRVSGEVRLSINMK